MKQLLFVCKGLLDKAVPIISIAQAFCAEGHRVEVVCSNISDALKKDLTGAGLIILSLDLDAPDNGNRIGGVFEKLHHWAMFRWRTKRILAQKTPDLLYLATADTAIALRGLVSHFKYVLHLRELYDEQPHYMKLLRKPAQQAHRVVVPEENRAYLYYKFLNLREVPTVIPNKPFYHPRQQKMNIAFLDPELQSRIAGKKNILYQGPIHPERNLGKLIRVSTILEDYNVILMGQDFGLIDLYRKTNLAIIHIPFVRPPLHLNITSWAHIGVITYDFRSLNTIYCAPNKSWEFAGFRIPVLGNRNPGLVYTVGAAKAGVIVDFEDEKSILDGIRYIENNYARIQDHADAFYNGVDTSRISQLI
ncbi:MAG: hypothetical protein JXB42_10930 [Deltaproteobacteria bacterium]|nr:hypothetical protein [Deltaproteobacteria bacterium]